MFAQKVIQLITRLNPRFQGKRFSTITVNGNSMAPTFSNGNRISISRNPYKTDRPILGDVVVFAHPGVKQTTFLKRIVGLPGDLIELKCKRIFVNNQSITPHAQGPVGHSQLLDLMWQLEGDEYFVLGDNPCDSLDSRRLGPIKLSWIIGKVW